MASVKLHSLHSLYFHDNEYSSHFQNTISLQFSSPIPFPTLIIRPFNRLSRPYCFNEQKDVPLDSSTALSTTMNEGADLELGSNKDGLIQSAVWVGVATIASKILGLLREIVLASVFGIGPVATAFKYASVLPGFAASLLGGVNGPIHITMATTLSKLPEERRRKLFQHTNAFMFLVGGAVGIIVFVFAESFIHTYAPGLWVLAEGQITREIAIAQLKIMIPCIIFAGPVGLGFGYMSAEGRTFLPSISPTFSSMLIIATCVVHVIMRRSNPLLSGDTLSGGMLIAFGASVGAFLQWIIQVITHQRMWHNSNSVPWINILKDKDIHEFLSLMLPATISSGLTQIASFTDLYFASLIPGAAAGISYAYLLVMAPLGLLSSMIVLPLLPNLSRVAKSLSLPRLMEILIQAVLLCLVLILPVLSTMCVLAKPIIRMLFQRYAFDSAASTLVSSLLLCYSFGSPFYLIRELLDAIFYALGDGQLPFLVTLSAIVLNAILDWIFTSRFHLGAKGLALSTSIVSAWSVFILFHLLVKKVAGVVDYAALVCPLLLLFSCCVVSGLTTSFAYRMLQSLLSSVFIIRFHRIQELLSISLAGLAGIINFFLTLIMLHFSGFRVVQEMPAILKNR